LTAKEGLERQIRPAHAQAVAVQLQFDDVVFVANDALAATDINLAASDDFERRQVALKAHIYRQALG